MPDPSTADGAAPSVEAEGASSQVLDSTAESSTAPGSTADTPAAQDSGSMLDALNAALQGPEGNSSDPGTGEAQAEAQTEQPAADGASEAETDPVPTEEELKRYVPKTRERIEKLVGALKEKDQQVQEFSQKAQALDQIMGSIRATGLEPNEVDTILEIGSLMKRDPQEALKRLSPIYELLSRQAGEVLPEDLAEEVRLGYVTEPRARELARARAGEQIRTQQLQQRDQADQAERAQQERAQQVQTVSSAADRWDAAKLKADPDYHLKRERIAELTELELLRRTRANQQVNGEQDVVAICEAAYKRATEEIKRLQPPPKSISNVSGVASPRVESAPKSMMDALNFGLANARRG